MDHPTRLVTAPGAGLFRRLARQPVWLLVPLALALAGCATTTTETRDTSNIRSALERGDCRAAHGELEANLAQTDVDTGLQVAHLCLQRGEFERARDLAADLSREHPEHTDRDFAAYLEGLARLGIWNRASGLPADKRLDRGRELFLFLANFLDEHATSRYTESLAPRLARLREDIAMIELALAEAAAEEGRTEEASARLRYVREHYPGTAAAETAAGRLDEDTSDGEMP